jgi:hypothetical protein
MAELRGGKISFQFDDARLDAKGAFTYNLGAPIREAIVGSDGVHGYKELPQVPMIEGIVTDRADLDVVGDILNKTDGTGILTLANGKTVVLRNAWYAGTGNITTDEGEIELKFEGLQAEEV